MENLTMTLKCRPLMAALAALAFVWPAGATITNYVTPAGAGSANGTDWGNAYSATQLQTAVDACGTTGDEIRLRYGTYTNNAQVSVVSRPGLTIRGGYLGDGETFTNAATVLTRGAAAIRIVYATNSTFTLDCLTISGGSDSSGAGLFLDNCNSTLTNCAVQSNIGNSGVGIYAVTGSLTIVDSVVRANADNAETFSYGFGIYAANAQVSLRRVTVANHSGPYGNGYFQGGGVYLAGGSALVDNCLFATNSFGGSRTEYGGALYATGVSPLTVTNCAFQGNRITAYLDGGAFGGALYVAGCNPAQIAGCVFFANAIVRSAALPMEGADFWLAGSGLIADCVVSGAYSGNDASESVFVNNTAGNTWLVRNTVMQGGLSGGVRKKGAGALVLTNCLINGFARHGVQVEAGTGVVAQCTLVDNGGWGLTNGAAAVTITNSILWGNQAGGVSSTNGTVAYTCSQEAQAGPSNSNVNPLFIAGYYLSVNGLLYQDADSPCIGAGSMTVLDAGLDARTTRTDGNYDTGQVDLGYHATNGVPTTLSNLVLYVDVVTGDDTNDGWSAGRPLKTIKNALTRVLTGSTINIATGRYNAASGETFPLDLATPNLTLKATNRATAVVDPATATRAFTVSGRGNVRFEGLTVANGRSGSGGGIYLPVCRATITNCVFSVNKGTSTTSKGGGVYAVAGTLTVVDTVFQGNGFAVNDAYQYGGAICAENGVTVVFKRVTVANSVQQDNSYLYGAGVYLSGGSAWISDCAFHTNAPSSGRTMAGGALYATGVNPLILTNCAFRGNAMANRMAGGYGGALYITGSGAVSILGCVFDRNYLSYVAANALEGGTLWLDGSGLITDSVIEKGDLGAPPENIFVNNAAGNTWLVRNTEVRGGLGIGVRKKGAGTLVLTNCLINGYANHGLVAEAGTAVVAQCTLAANGGWGLTNGAASAQVRDSIAWGNVAGGINSTNGTITYTCSQETLAGTSNLNVNPLFIAGYYLSVNGLPAQSADSPCIDAGSMAAAAAGMDARTTRTDGGFDANTVDLGYHGLTGSMALSNLVLYVDVVTGDDTNDGWSAVSPLKTIKAALARAMDGSTINIATGRYNAASGETFPLDMAAPNLTLKATNRATTIVDAGAAARAFSASGQGRVWFEGMTVTNGRAATGAGLYLPSCQATVTNCAFLGNICNNATSKGGGIYAVAGSLTVVDTLFQSNGEWGVECALYGGALCAESGVAVTMNRVTVANHVTLQNNSHIYGAGLYLSGGSAFIAGCAFTTNAPQQSSGRTWQGGALYATGVSPLTLTNCTFRGNRMYGAGAGLYVAAGGPSRILNCVFDGNYLVSGNSAMEGASMRLAGSGLISDCVVTGSVAGSAPDEVYVNNSAGESWAIWKTILCGGRGMGVSKQGTGILALTNSLVHSFTNHGIVAVAGSVDLACATFANNGGWGVSNATGAVTGRNCIAWGNTKGGFTNCSVTYTCSQEAQAGDGNKNMDPLFEGAVTNNFRLLRASPCVNTGLNEDWMIDARDLDGNARIIGKVVDMGAYEMTSPPASGAMIIVK